MGCRLTDGMYSRLPAVLEMKSSLFQGSHDLIHEGKPVVSSRHGTYVIWKYDDPHTNFYGKRFRLFLP